MLAQKAVETAVKHIVARSTKQFFGYGPAERVTIVIQGALVLFATRFSGPGILEALPGSPFGRLAMRHIADLFARTVAPDLAGLAGGEFGVRLRAIDGDLDFESGQSLGIALLDQPLPPPDRPAAPAMARLLTQAVTEAAQAAGIAPPQSAPAVRIGPGALVLWAPDLHLPEGGDTAEAQFGALAAREAFRTRLRAGLVAAAASQGLSAGPCFVVDSETGLVAGTLLTL
ncbi:MAG TPA: hypothetical protein VK464_27870 [Symbiobacteriaceae bacterium]|jgi:hypothetical protein|nr:hypothetical protein [Symbiobacteriaceae bacterium]